MSQNVEASALRLICMIDSKYSQGVNGTMIFSLMLVASVSHLP
jgi:hypothetical protein